MKLNKNKNSCPDKNTLVNSFQLSFKNIGTFPSINIKITENILRNWATNKFYPP